MVVREVNEAIDWVGGRPKKIWPQHQSNSSINQAPVDGFGCFFEKTENEKAKNSKAKNKDEENGDNTKNVNAKLQKLKMKKPRELQTPRIKAKNIKAKNIKFKPRYENGVIKSA